MSTLSPYYHAGVISYTRTNSVGVVLCGDTRKYRVWPNKTERVSYGAVIMRSSEDPGRSIT